MHEQPRIDVAEGAAHCGDLPVLDIQKNSRERFRIAHTTFKGRPYIDLRVWYVDGAGDYQPSRAGITIRPSQVAEIVQGLMLAARAVDPQGVN